VLQSCKVQQIATFEWHPVLKHFRREKKAVKFRSCNKNQFTLKKQSQLKGKKNLVFSIFPIQVQTAVFSVEIFVKTAVCFFFSCFFLTFRDLQTPAKGISLNTSSQHFSGL